MSSPINIGLNSTCITNNNACCPRSLSIRCCCCTAEDSEEDEKIRQSLEKMKESAVKESKKNPPDTNTSKP